MPKELPPQYNAKEVEDKIYRQWEKSGFFNPDNLPPGPHTLSTKPFTIIMPPPNANGALHIGHAVFVTLQDIMIRFQRMRGKKALWLPGADHAGIETEYVYRKKLEKEGKRWNEIPRNQLYQDIYKFTQANKTIMENQLRKLGASCDWSREKFTLDPVIVKKVTDTFIKLYEDGLIYRGTRIVNWSVKDQTALSDLEIEYREQKDPLYYIKYGPLELATVRPETKFGDTAVAVHPRDGRYQKYIGKEIEIETLLGSAKIKVIADEAVDPEFGTGVIKVTPAHDPADFEIGLRHNLEIRQVIDRYGKLNEKTGPYAGLKVEEARQRVAEDMKAKGFITKVEENYIHSVAYAKRSGGIIEPMVLPQWFVKTASLRDAAVKTVRSGKIKFVPPRFEKVFFHWMKNLRDWNISRQIIWGIRIPAWFCVGCGDIRMRPQIKGNWYFVRHGETNWNVERRIQGQGGGGDPSLNARGRGQAAATADQLRGADADIVISSDLARARETAEIIARKLKVELLLDHGFRERRYGVLEGKLRDDLSEEDHIKLAEREYAPDGGESLAALEERVYRTLHLHKKKHIHKNVIIVSHGSALKMLLGTLRNLPFESRGETLFHNAGVVHFSVADGCKKCGSDFVEQDPDVLDTWFSSGQWPFLTLGYPKHKDFKTFYPTDVMETGWDILFFWVARMIMLGIYRTGQVPFRTVYLHGLVRDKDRQKISKSKGNVIDPLGVAELYGTDAVRMALVVGNLPGNDIVISEEKIRGYRNFANKIWNASRFLLHHLDSPPQKNKVKFGAKEKTMLAKLKRTAKEVTRDLESYKFHHAAEELYHFFWHYYADKVIEEMKPRLASDPGTTERETAKALLLEFHSALLKLLHPFMPFITEEIWSRLPTKKKKLLIIERWPK